MSARAWGSTISRADALCGLRELHTDESGMLSFPLTVAVLFFAVLTGFAANVGVAVIEKIEVQNAADASAYSSSLVMARGMNAVTATNHLIGEMMAFVVIHEAIGGDQVDGAELTRSERRLAAWYDRILPGLAEAAKNVGGRAVAVDDVRKRLRAAATVGQGKLRLKKALVRLYAAQIAAYYIPYVGQAIIQALNAVEVILLIQWRALDAMETLARETLPLKRLLFEILLPTAKRYEDEVVRLVPEIAAETADEVARLNGCLGSVFPRRPELPVVQETIDFSVNNEYLRMQESQIVRATYPWVKYHRKPILDALDVLDSLDVTGFIGLDAMPLYRHWVTVYTVRKSETFYHDQGSTIYVMKHSDKKRKGREPWTTDSAEADRLFSVIGFARRDSPSPFAPPVFRRQNAEGIVAHAQAIVYNANSQKPGQGPPVLQREVGWDTLNWDAPAHQSFAYEFKQGDGRFGMPRIRLNWQTKLVPVTPWLDEAPAELDPPFADVIGRIVPVSSILRTH
jgi:hypothetical protein